MGDEGLKQRLFVRAPPTSKQGSSAPQLWLWKGVRSSTTAIAEQQPLYYDYHVSQTALYQLAPGIIIKWSFIHSII
jgi:hypothetical protein